MIMRPNRICCIAGPVVGKQQRRRLSSHILGAKYEPQKKTLTEFLIRQCEADDARLIASFENDENFTFGEMFDEATKFAAGLVANGLKQGDAVGIWAQNTPKWLIVKWACLIAGFPLVTINPHFTASELAYTINKVSIKAIVCPRKLGNLDHYAVLSQMIPDLQSQDRFKINSKNVLLEKIVLFENSGMPGTLSWADVVDSADASHFSTVHSTKVRDSDIGVIQFTSGTTGQPKAAALSHFNMANYALAYNKVYPHMNADTILLNLLPLYHVFSFLDGAIFGASIGCCNVYPSPKFTSLSSVQAIAKHKATDLIGTPTMFSDIINDPDRNSYNLSTLKHAVVGGAPTSPSLVRAALQELGLSLSNGYGMTENTGGTTLTPHGSSEDVTVNTVGFLMPGLECKVIDTDGNVCARNEVGELVTKGWNIFQGYLNEDKATQDCFTEDNFFKTGDLAVVRDDKAVRLVGRVKEMIIRGGENIQPTEVEDFIESIPGVQDCYVIGVPSRRLGQESAAYIKLKSDSNLSPNDILNECSKGLARFKHPRFIKFTESYPEFATGKIKKTELYKWALRDFPDLLLELDESS